jgi:hypothetical protein
LITIFFYYKKTFKYIFNSQKLKNKVNLFKFLFKIFNNLVFIILIQFIKKAKVSLDDGILFKKTKFLQHCFFKLKLFYPFELNKLNNLKFKLNKYNNLIDS